MRVLVVLRIHHLLVISRPYQTVSRPLWPHLEPSWIRWCDLFSFIEWSEFQTGLVEEAMGWRFAILIVFHCVQIASQNPIHKKIIYIVEEMDCNLYEKAKSRLLDIWGTESCYRPRANSIDQLQNPRQASCSVFHIVNINIDFGMPSYMLSTAHFEL